MDRLNPFARPGRILSPTSPSASAYASASPPSPAAALPGPAPEAPQDHVSPPAQVVEDQALTTAPAAPEAPAPLASAPEPVAAPADVAPSPTHGRPGPDDPRLHEAIRELRNEIDLVGVMIATSDGLALAYDLPSDDSLRIAAMAATGLGLGRRLVDSFGHESFQEQVTRGSDGYFVVYSAGRDAVLAVIAPASCNLGMLHHQARRLATRLGALLAGPS